MRQDLKIQKACKWFIYHVVNDVKDMTVAFHKTKPLEIQCINQPKTMFWLNGLVHLFVEQLFQPNRVATKTSGTSLSQYSMIS